MKAFLKRIQPHFIWWALALGTALIVISLFLEEIRPCWVSVNKKLSEVGIAVLVSGVFASLLKSYQFAGLFQEELEKFFATPDTLQKLRDIMVYGREGDDVIQKGMEHLGRKLLPDIHQDDLAAATKGLLPTRTEYSIRDYERKITICDYDPSTEIVTISDSVYSRIIAHEDCEYRTVHTGPAYALAALTISKVEVTEDGVARSILGGLDHNDERLIVPFKVARGKRASIFRVWTTKFPLRLDPLIQAQFQRFCDNLDLRIVNRVPTKIDFNVQFVNYAKEPEHTVVPQAHHEVEHWYRVDRLTFPLQGYIVTLSPKI